MQNFSELFHGIYVITKREFFMNLKSIRMIILMIIFTLFILFSVYVGSFVMGIISDMPDLNINNLEQGPVFILFFVSSFISFIGPIIAIILSFDVIVREKIQNSLGLLLCRPVSRRTIALGKFLGVIGAMALPIIIVNIIAIIVISAISGKGIEVSQAGGFIILTLLFLAIYVAIAQLISSISKTTTTAILGGISIWFLFWLLLPIITEIIPSSDKSINRYIELINPGTSYSQCISDVLGGSTGSPPIPLWGYYILLILWLFGILILAIEIFERKEE